MQQKLNRNPRKLALLLLGTMIFFALFDSPKNILIPAFKQTFEIGNTIMGSLVFASSLSFTIMTYFSGKICEKLGHKKMIVGSLFGLALVALGIWRVESSLAFAVLFVGQSIFIAPLVFGLNTMVPLIPVRNSALLMNLLHFCYSLGAMTMSKSIGQLLGTGVAWPRIYLFTSLGLIGVVGFNLFASYPTGQNQVQPHGKTEGTLSLKNPLLLGVIGAFSASIVAETTIGQWFSNYMVEGFSFEVNQAANLLFYYLALHAIGRLIGGFVAGRFGTQKTLVCSLAAACVLTLTGILLKEQGLFLIAGAGLFLSINYPTSLLLAQSLFPTQSMRATSLVLTSISFINMFTGIVVGVLNDQITAYRTFFLIPVMLVVSLAFHIFVGSHVRDREPLQNH
jgi:fucose permease